MLKIIITDVHLMPPDVLKETGTYLLRLAGCTSPDAQMMWSPLTGNTQSAVNSVPSVFPVPTIDSPDTLPDANNPCPEVPYMPLSTAEETLEHVSTETIGIERDINGLPWDARIHTRTRSKTIDGIWKLQRGINLNTVDTVMKEIKQVMALPPGKPVPVAPIAPPPTPTAPIAPQWGTAPVPITPVAIDPVNDECPADYNTFIGRISKHIAKGLIGHHQVKAICEQYGVPSLPLVASRPDLIPQIAAAIDIVAGG